MVKNNFKHSSLAIATALALTLTACGGGDEDGQAASVEKTGQFIDAAVANLDVYQKGKKIATTDSEGKFVYMTGSEVTFKVGQLTLGSTMPKAIVTPADLSANTADVIEILQALQSLDEDNNPDNGIFINQVTLDKLITDLDLSDSDVSLADTLKKDMPDLAIVSEQEALDHFADVQDEVKVSDELKQAASELVGFWVQSCEYAKASGTTSRQRVVEYYFDATNPTLLKQKNQIVEREYSSDDCSGSYDEDYRNTNNSMNLQITGISTDDDGHKVFNGLMIKGDEVIPQQAVWLDENTFIGGSFTRTRTDSLSFPTDEPVNNEVAQAVDTMVGHWKSDCIQSNDGSKRYYLNFTKASDTQLNVVDRLQERFTTSNCTGTGTVSEIEDDMDGDVITLNKNDLPEFQGMNRFIADGDDAPEAYNRISESEFPVVGINTVEDTVNTMVGYWKSECLSNNSGSELSYIQIEKKSASKINVTSNIVESFSNDNCSGQAKDTTKALLEPEEILLSEEDLPDFTGNNTFTVENEVYNRISKSELISVADKATVNNTVPVVTDINFTPASGNQKAFIVVKFNTPMKSRAYFSGEYSPANTFWQDHKTYVIEFNDYLPGGTITFSGYDDRDGSKGFQNSSGIAMQQDKTFIFPQ